MLAQTIGASGQKQAVERGPCSARVGYGVRAPASQRANQRLQWTGTIDPRTATDRPATKPRPLGCKKLKGRDSYRIREGDYRIIYEIEANILTVIVVMQATEKIFMNKSILAYTIALKTSLSIKLPSLLLSNCG